MSNKKIFKVFCTKCGSQMIKTSEGLPSDFHLILYDYSLDNGEPNIVYKYVCPKRKKTWLGTFNNHDVYYCRKKNI